MSYPVLVRNNIEIVSKAAGHNKRKKQCLTFAKVSI